MRLVEIEIDRGAMMDLTTVGGLRIGRHIIREGRGSLPSIGKMYNVLTLPDVIS